jgi:hypothetical protein
MNHIKNKKDIYVKCEHNYGYPLFYKFLLQQSMLICTYFSLNELHFRYDEWVMLARSLCVRVSWQRNTYTTHGEKQTTPHTCISQLSSLSACLVVNIQSLLCSWCLHFRVHLIASVVSRPANKLISLIVASATLTCNLHLFCSHEDMQLRSFVCMIRKLHHISYEKINLNKIIVFFFETINITRK